MSGRFDIPSLGRLTSVDLRQVWPSEPYSFTPWLALPENLQLLAESVGLPGLELVATEQQVDIFSADIVAKAADSGETVLIENQIERSDHTHLGQILTYAAGLDAAIVIWVARQFTEGHRAAMDWLNRVTAKEFAFFAIQVEAFRIAESPAAPRFTIISRPNEWQRALREVSQRPDSTNEVQANVSQAYWNGYEVVARSIEAPVRISARQVRSTNYYVPSTEASCYYSIWRSSSEQSVGVYFSMFGDKSQHVYEYLTHRRTDIEERFGGNLEWSVRKPGSTYWIIAGSERVSLNEEDWPRQHAWLAQMMKRLKDAIAPTLSGLALEGGE
jgi:hypothetical protein